MSTNNENEKRPRKVMSGPVRDKSRTMSKMVASVGKVILHYGYAGLTPRNIIEEANIDRKLLYVHFGTLEQLIEAYVRQKAAVLLALKSGWESRIGAGNETVAEFTILLKWIFDELSKEQEIVKLIHWELGDHSGLLAAFSDARKALEKCMIQYADRVQAEARKNIQSSLSLLLGSAYYLLMQSVSANPSVKVTDKDESNIYVKDALNKLVDFAFGK